MVGALLACLACFTPLAVVALGAIGLGAWTGCLDLVMLAALVAFGALVAYRYRACRGRTP